MPDNARRGVGPRARPVPNPASLHSSERHIASPTRPRSPPRPRHRAAPSPTGPWPCNSRRSRPGPWRGPGRGLRPRPDIDRESPATASIVALLPVVSGEPFVGPVLGRLANVSLEELTRLLILLECGIATAQGADEREEIGVLLDPVGEPGLDRLPVELDQQRHRIGILRAQHEELVRIMNQEVSTSIRSGIALIRLQVEITLSGEIAHEMIHMQLDEAPGGSEPLLGDRAELVDHRLLRRTPGR